MADDDRTGAGSPAGIDEHLRAERQLLRRLWGDPLLVSEATMRGLESGHFLDERNRYLFETLRKSLRSVSWNADDKTRDELRDAAKAWLESWDRAFDMGVELLNSLAPSDSTLASEVAVVRRNARERSEHRTGSEARVLEQLVRHPAPAKSEARAPLDIAGDAVDSTLSGPGKPSYQPFRIAPTAEDSRPVLVVIAGPKGSGADAISNMAEMQLAGKDGGGRVTILGREPLEPGQHRAAAEKAIEQKSNTILLTDGRDPEALARDMQGFARDYRIVFAAAATQNPLLGLNNLEARLDPRSPKRETLTTRPKLAECASRAAGLGAETHVFEADENGRVVNAPAPPGSGERTPGQRVEDACKAPLSEEMSLRALAKAARLATMTKDPEDHGKILRVTADILRASPDGTAESLGGVVGAAIALHPRRVPFNLAKGFDLSAFAPSSQSGDSPWHVDGRVRPDKSLKLTGSKDLETMLVDRLRGVRKAAKEAEYLRSELNDRLRKGPGRTAEEKAEYEAQKNRLQYLQRCSEDHLKMRCEGVQSVLAEYRRRARLTPGQHKELERKAREHKARTAVTGIGYGTKRTQAAQQLRQPQRRPLAAGSRR